MLQIPHGAATHVQRACAILLGVAVTLSLRGYQFGNSNHTVYLLDALRQADPRLLERDWFINHTFQYHMAFAQLTRWLMSWHIERPGFLVGYLAGILLLHAAWLAIARRLGGSIRTYLLSVVLFYISAGGTGLGAFQFEQDGAFLPSNLANVAMLWAIWAWLDDRPVWSAALLGIAGFWHINHAAVGIGLWTALVAWRVLDHIRGRQTAPTGRPKSARYWVLGAALLVGLSATNLVPTLMEKAAEPSNVPLSEYVRLYAYLRHPHHYAPLTWPAGIWISFLWTIPLALWAGWREVADTGTGDGLPRQRRFAWIEASKVAAILLGLMIVGLLGAGIWFVSESLVQLAVWRFSIYVMVLSCIGTSHLLLDLDVMPAWTRRWIPTVVVLAAVGLLLAVGRLEPGPHGMARAARFVHENVTPLCVFIALCAAIAGVCAVWRSDRTVGGLPGTAVAGAVLLVALGIAARERCLGLNLLPEDDSAYLSMCRWVRGHTPTDALFVVPPGEQAFRLVAQRAIVINFKGVPQLAGQLPEWRDRLQAVLAMNNLSELPQPFDRTLAAIDARYESLPDGHLADVARRYGARYVLIGRSMAIGTLVHAVGRYCLYDLSDFPPTTQTAIEHRTDRS